MLSTITALVFSLISYAGILILYVLIKITGLKKRQTKTLHKMQESISEVNTDNLFLKN